MSYYPHVRIGYIFLLIILIVLVIDIKLALFTAKWYEKKWKTSTNVMDKNALHLSTAVQKCCVIQEHLQCEFLKSFYI